ncbi:MAG: hypothetical protein R6W69_02565 [Anaerolineales bacterium]
MKRTRLLLLGAALLLAILLAWLMSGFVRQSLLVPTLEYAWLLQKYYEMIPQSWQWGILVAIVLLGALFSLSSTRASFSTAWLRTRRIQTPGSELAFWLARISQGQYQRWFVAHRLATLARELLREQGVQIERGDTLVGPGWNPPDEIQKYLQAALYSSPKTFDSAAKAAGLDTDPEVETIIQYLETYAEASHEH